MKRYLLQWCEIVENNCSVEIEAESKEEAYAKWNEGQFGDYDRDENSNSFDGPPEIEEIDS
jgi:hypothetical protein